MILNSDALLHPKKPSSKGVLINLENTILFDGKYMFSPIEERIWNLKKNWNSVYLRAEGFSRVVRELGHAAFPMLEPVSELT